MQPLKFLSKTSISINQKILAILLLGFLLSPATARAAFIRQTFESSWSVDVWDFYGDVSAMNWHYQPYTPWDSSLGTLTSVEILLELSGTRHDAADTVRIRSSLFTGWNPVEYQYSQVKYIAGGDVGFSGIWSSSYTTPEAISAVTDYRYFTGVYDSGAGSGGAWYYFESRTENDAHTIAAKTTLLYHYDPISVPDPVPEPTSIALWGIAALGMGLFVRRKKHSLSLEV
jgi:hypothetical protein